MIETRNESVFYLNNALRLHGSAALRAMVPAAISTGMLLVIVLGLDNSLEYNDEHRWVIHPYVLQVLIVGFTFIITFRANFAYGRYWEGATAVHQMMSKWLDVGMTLASFHYQSVHFDTTRPASFGDHPESNFGTLDRQRLNEMTQSQYEASLPNDDDSSKRRIKLPTFFRKQRMNRASSSFLRARRQERRRQSINAIPGTAAAATAACHRFVPNNNSIPSPVDSTVATTTASRTMTTRASNITSAGKPSKYLPELEVVTDSLSSSNAMIRKKPLRGTADLSSLTEDDQPTLFLQETCHLISLLSAVAMSTLRNDEEGAESPLVEYIPGEPWPPVDPDMLHSSIRQQFHESSRIKAVLYFLLGLDRSPRHLTLYNAARPFGVLGGVSDAEISELQQARGPSAKVGLCCMWLQEYISRESLAGSTDGVHAALLSRVYQYTSDGMVGYNQSRKISYNPFPFPHEQGTIMVLFMLVVIFPVLYYSFVNNLAMACALNFVTVMCFVGLHEVARELENPFWNYPNDLPLITFQAQFNEALLQTYSGFDPDFYNWKPNIKVSSSCGEGEVVDDKLRRSHGSNSNAPDLKEEEEEEEKTEVG